MNDPNITVGILAHVDAGKTTLSEAILYLSGVVRSQGRVDHKDAFLDTYALEKSRGITIFSKQALFSAYGKKFTLLDTPGHTDFSPEMERSLQVLDAAVLVISAADGINGQVRVLWRLLTHYHVPVFLFINKMDQPGADHDRIYSRLRESLSDHIVDFTKDPNRNGTSSDPASAWYEDIAVCEEQLLSSYLEGHLITANDISRLIRKRNLFPCFFGSALKLDGIDTFLHALAQYISIPDYPDSFGARVFKISRDETGKRLTWLKITGGTLKVRDLILQSDTNGQSVSEKIDQIRLYSGVRYESVPEVSAGSICTVTGLSCTHSGDGLGTEQSSEEELLQPILRCRILLTDDADPFRAYQNLRILEEEEPMLHISRNDDNGELYAQVMGRIQMEILQHLMLERFGMQINFGPATIVYKETIAAPVEGVGHFEPLRHYAEVHLLMEPTEPGSGMTFDAHCSTDLLDRNWQHLILTHLEEKRHKGILTGSDLTDMRITLVNGRASMKHTEGGDFRQATYRAVRQGLMMAQNILLEPVLTFRLEVPPEALGHALTDLQKMNATVNPSEITDDKAVLTGTVPAACLGDYAQELSAYTHGEGSLSVSFCGYQPCHNAEAVIAAAGYVPDLDMDNPSSSVFCSHGAGTIVPWNQVRSMMHAESEWIPDTDAPIPENLNQADARSYADRERAHQSTEKELTAIFERTYGPVRSRYDALSERTRAYGSGSISADSDDTSGNTGGDPRYQPAKKNAEPIREYLLVDGYNILYASSELQDLAQTDLKAARDRLMDILSNFQGYRRETVILIFDAYKVAGGQERVLQYHNLNIVYTREAETADQYIEKAVHDLSGKHRVTVATSDAVEQVIIYGQGAMRLSARDFWSEVSATEQKIREDLMHQPRALHNHISIAEKDKE